jgi:hypothetical protein
MVILTCRVGYELDWSVQGILVTRGGKSEEITNFYNFEVQEERLTQNGFDRRAREQTK